MDIIVTRMGQLIQTSLAGRLQMFKLHFHSSLYNKLNNDYQGFWHNHK
ncbi:hypothetical protein A3R75_005327 [Salmonella enterica subsp. diarizonae]|nr:hypothetical protein [Salmonella enterica subsp. diarizonae]EJY6447067.1 hypothetical protein [Salmonella enterica]EKJ0770113.1 hypothetical protein [Salmonella enterica]EKO1024426.1 hypothetical protein [Salmonella enterica subsp. enterica]